MRKILTEVVVETTELTIVRRRRQFIRAFCEECRREVSLVPPAEAALLSFCEPATIYGLIAENRVHVRFFARERKPFICLPSLCLI